MPQKQIGVYAVKNDEDNGLRYFAIGIKNEDKSFTGIIHDYVGGGSYEEALVYKDTFLPQAYSDGEVVEWDDSVELFDKISPVSLEQLEERLYAFASYNTTQFNYFIEDESLDSFENNKVLIDNANLSTPYGLGNTTFPDGYEVNSYDGSFEDFKKEMEAQKTVVSFADLPDDVFEEKILEYIKTKALTEGLWGHLLESTDMYEGWKEEFIALLRTNHVKSPEALEAFVVSNNYWRNQHLSKELKDSWIYSVLSEKANVEQDAEMEILFRTRKP